jgi:hypothetical protein
MPPLLSKSLERVRIEQEPVRVFVSVQFHCRFQFHKRSQLFIGANEERFRHHDARQPAGLFAL